MRARWSTLSLNQKLASAALGLGLVALFAQPGRGHVVRVDVKELAAAIDAERDHVTVGELAAWIVEGRSDFRLIDLRGEADFAAYHIPGAENLTLAALPDAPLAPVEKIVLYSDGGIHGAQAWMLMRARGYANTYTLKGGLDQWKEDVLFPAEAENASPAERALFERTAAMARFFGGSPRTGVAGAAAGLPDLPKVAAPAAPVGGPARAPKKKKEGC